VIFWNDFEFDSVLGPVLSGEAEGAAQSKKDREVKTSTPVHRIMDDARDNSAGATIQETGPLERLARMAGQKGLAPAGDGKEADTDRGWFWKQGGEG